MFLLLDTHICLSVQTTHLQTQMYANTHPHTQIELLKVYKIIKMVLDSDGFDIFAQNDLIY